MKYIKIGIAVPQETVERYRRYNKRNPEHPINVSAALNSILNTLLDEYEGDEKTVDLIIKKQRKMWKN